MSDTDGASWPMFISITKLEILLKVCVFYSFIGRNISRKDVVKLRYKKAIGSLSARDVPYTLTFPVTSQSDV